MPKTTRSATPATRNGPARRSRPAPSAVGETRPSAQPSTDDWSALPETGPAPVLPQPTPAEDLTPAQPGGAPPVLMALYFDRAFYEQRNSDVRESGVDPATHYFVYGYKERRAPNALFDPHAYVRANPDLAAFEGDLFLHYIFYGVSEGRPLA